MDLLCQPGVINGSRSSLTWNTCQGDWFNIAVCLFAIYVALLIIAYLLWMGSSRVTSAKNIILAGHIFRSYLAIVLFLIHSAELADAFLSNAPTYVFIVPSVALMLLIIQLILEHLIERTCRNTLFIVSGFLWLANGMTRTLRLIILWNMGINMDRLRPFTAALSLTVYCIISISAFLAAKRELGGITENESCTAKYDIHCYLYDEVNFFSKATFYWMNHLLKAGYKSPIELEDLGVLPVTHSAQTLHKKLEDVMLNSEGALVPSLVWKIFLKFMKREFLIGGMFKLLGDMVGIIGPLGISVIVNFVAERKASKDLHFDNNQEIYASIFQLWKNGWTTAFIVFFASIAQSTFSQASTHLVTVKSIQLKVALQSVIYKKSMRLKTYNKCNQQTYKNSINEKSDDENFDLGVLVNLMSNDAANIMSFFWIGHYIWAIPVKMCVIMIFLYMKLGISAVIGAASTILILMPLQLCLGKEMSKNTAAISELTDERLQHLGVLIEKLKLFKLLGWENYFCNRILKFRKKELELLDKDSIFWAILTFSTHVSSVLVSLTTFGIHYLFSDTTLTPDSVFSTLALINQLMVPLFILPVIIPKISDAMVSCNRISEFLRFSEVIVEHKIKNVHLNLKYGTSQRFEKSQKMTAINEDDENRFPGVSNEYEVHNTHFEEEYKKISDILEYHTKTLSSIIHNNYPEKHTQNLHMCKSMQYSGTPDWVMIIEDGIFSWNPDILQKRLVVEKLRIPAGALVVVIGKVGSGKSSLLAAILGEITQLSGRSIWSGNVSIAYCPQTPWLLNSTIRDNILFGLPFRSRRYEQVLAACALKSDLDILPKKDQTEIGIKGINLSGGQKQRIAIARALYSRAKLVILDDPLSSLDISMAASIFEEGIKRVVRGCNRTVVMVTHNFNFLNDSSFVIAMEDGKIKAQGKPNDIDISDFELIKMWKETSATPESSASKENRAKERWQLVKSIASITRNLRVKELDKSSWLLENNMSAYLKLRSNRKFVSNHLEWNFIIPDLPPPTDELQSKILVCTTSWKKTSARKKEIGRASSLQDRQTKTPQVVRQYSSPLSTDSNKEFGVQRKPRVEAIRHFLNTHSNMNVRIEVDSTKLPGMVSSSESGVSDNEVTGESIESWEDCIGKSPEEREYGKMRNKVYKTYIKACGVYTAAAYIIVTLMWQIVRVNTDFWLSIWTETPTTLGVMKYLYIYGLLSVGAVILSLLSHGLGQYSGSQARKKLHDFMLLNIIKCPNKSLECTPAGRIFNIFSADVEVIDKKLATTIQRLIQFLLLCSSSIVINTITTPWFIVITIPMVLLYYIIQMFYRCSSRELQRIDSVTRSPIFTHFAETISGLVTIRAFRYEDKFISNFFRKLDDYLGGIIVLMAMVTALVALQFYPDSITPSLVGLAMNYTLLVPVYLNWVVKFFVDCEIYLGAVERIRQFMTLPTESNNQTSVLDNFHPESHRLGDILFENVTLGYGHSREPVLIRINLHIPPGQKIGVCGRSGSGKSSLALSLFNMLEVHEGTIKIDGVDIKNIPLKHLRTIGSIIPQETLLFNGTVRENLDASGLSTDDQLWSAINEAYLKEIIDNHYSGNLGSEMNSGLSLSGGEKQLFSLARAILQNSSFLIMDEATSNLDKECEQILMSTAQKVFQGKTLIIIAHRLSTILDCDRIIVLERGKIVEDGTPSSLMNREGGIFSAMVKSSEGGFLIP